MGDGGQGGGRDSSQAVEIERTALMSAYFMRHTPALEKENISAAAIHALRVLLPIARNSECVMHLRLIIADICVVIFSGLNHGNVHILTPSRYVARCLRNLRRAMRIFPNTKHTSEKLEFLQRVFSISSGASQIYGE